MSEEKRIVVKRITAGRDGHHGGGWKIAYADFMTAMMAFFLVMWLLSISTDKQREGIAERFRMPLKVALSGGDKASLSSSVIPGGGPDSMKSEGERQVTEEDRQADEEAARLAEVKRQIEELIEKHPVFRQFQSQILIDLTTEGLRLQIVDSEKRPMFELASARLAPYTRAILRALAPALNELPNKITLSGHTDAIVYTNGDRSYGNWELSADRANASRRELVIGGMDEKKVMRVVGLADSMHLDKADPRNPINRRISIILLNRKTQQQIEHENSAEVAFQPGPAVVAAKASTQVLSPASFQPPAPHP
ncbi:flagellar motor protein MotB [Variovorax dokdonensis]|uniref:Flagellar motor protein MotB n=1 Tax=Variovorax dokdonensis TaxID=344883 RepID=A0ABT7N4Y1_9BURK|nr:flagellar motor protein MotB [Variovorax dokdonensis]MDM0042978.1 flagellar motor protein MotB [Variovorax dokdonensis]